MLSSMVSLVTDRLLLGLVILGRYLPPCLFLLLLFLVGSILLVLGLFLLPLVFLF